MSTPGLLARRSPFSATARIDWKSAVSIRCCVWYGSIDVRADTDIQLLRTITNWIQQHDVASLQVYAQPIGC